MSDFGTNLSQGVSIAISGIAYLIPWAFILGLAVWVGRKLWRRRKQLRENA
jgi:lauroyl/myristoyl acyltransferase